MTLKVANTSSGGVRPTEDGIIIRARGFATGPKGYQRSDERLREDISERLMESHYIDSSDVSVEVRGARVVLEGTVPSRQMKHAIEDLVDACRHQVTLGSANGERGG